MLIGLWRVVSFCLIFSNLFAEDAKVDIKLPARVAVVGPMIHLGEIAELTGRYGMDVGRYRDLPLRNAPVPGSTLTITDSDIKIALQQNGYDLDFFDFSGGKQVIVKTESRAIKISLVLDSLKGAIQEQLGNDGGAVDSRLLTEDSELMVPTGNLKVDLRPSSEGLEPGEDLLTARLSIDGRFFRDVPIRAEIEVTQPLVVANQAIPKGDRFSRENISIKNEPVSIRNGQTLKDVNSLIGKKAAVDIAKGTPILMSYVCDPPIIVHGMVLEGIAIKGAVEISVRVVALEDGKIGESIKVENTETHKVLVGKIQNEKTVTFFDLNQ